VVEVVRREKGVGNLFQCCQVTISPDPKKEAGLKSQKRPFLLRISAISCPVRSVPRRAVVNSRWNMLAECPAVVVAVVHVV